MGHPTPWQVDQIVEARSPQHVAMLLLGIRDAMPFDCDLDAGYLVDVLTIAELPEDQRLRITGQPALFEEAACHPSPAP
jgi:hypothetical protein